MKAEIISSGTELLLGEVIDTNAPYLARELARIGVDVYHQSTVGDNPKRLLDMIIQAESRSDIIMISGGLGPTQDDITKDILAEHLGLELVIDPLSLKKIKGRFQDEAISKENRHQALVIESSQVLKNDIGMAAGIFLKKNQHYYVLLPGPPNEFEHMVSEYLMDALMNEFGNSESLKSRNLNFYGLPEAKIAEKLSDLIEKQKNPTIAIYAKKGIIDIRLTASGSDKEEKEKLLDQVEEKIQSRIGEYFVSYNKKTMKDIIREKLAKMEQSFSILAINMNSHYLLSLNENSLDEQILKTSLYFPRKKRLETFFGENIIEEKTGKPKGEKIKTLLKEELESDYLLYLFASGEIEVEGQVIPEKLDLYMLNKNGEIHHERESFHSKMYLADWVIDLKITDFLRRYFLSIDELNN